MTQHQQKQIEIVNRIEKQIQEDTEKFSFVAPVEDYENDPRICLTGVHFPTESFLASVKQIIDPLREVEPSYFYYPDRSLHMTIKNVRVINDPPQFTDIDVKIAEKVFSEVIPQHTSYSVYFYRLLLFKNNLALIATTDPELDAIILNLDEKLKQAGIPDDKVYSNTKYFFCNMTLARFSKASENFIRKVGELSQSIHIDPYSVDSVTLITANAVFVKQRIINTWKLRVPSA